MTTEPYAENARYVKVSIWTRRDSDGETYEVYKLPDGTEYRGNLYALIDGQAGDSGVNSSQNEDTT